MFSILIDLGVGCADNHTRSLYNSQHYNDDGRCSHDHDGSYNYFNNSSTNHNYHDIFCNNCCVSVFICANSV